VGRIMRIVKMAQENPDSSGGIIPQVNIKDHAKFSWFQASVNRQEIQWKSKVSFHLGSSAAVINCFGFMSGPFVSMGIYTYNLKFAFGTQLRNSVLVYGDLGIDLYININRKTTGQGQEIVATWLWPYRNANDSYFKDDSFREFLASNFGLSNINLPHEVMAKQQVEAKAKKTMNGREIVDGIRLTRMRRSNFPAQSLEIYVFKSPSDKHYTMAYSTMNLESGQKIIQEKSIPIITHSLAPNEEMVQEMRRQAEAAMQNKGYVDQTSSLYIPEGANADNWDFRYNTYKSNLVPENVSSEADEGSENLTDLLSQEKMKVRKLGQEFEGYFAGEVPDYATNMLGTSSVEASQIQSMFGRSSEAIDLVNQFDSSLLSNISFVFNFAKSGAYGVYLSELDRAIKTKALQQRLEQMGYIVEPDERGLLKAYADKESNDKTIEQIQSDIDSIYQGLESKGGSAIGINMRSILDASRQDAASTESQDPNIWELMAVLHLGGTLVHEAIHARGATDEGTAETQETVFLSWALPKINEKYLAELRGQGKEEMFTPLTIGSVKRHANRSGWYKMAQMNYHPQSLYGKPTGSDIRGRFPNGYTPETGLAGWDKEMQSYQNTPIEKRLSREFMSPLPPDLDQEHDSLEEQLRKYTRDDKKLDPNAIMEELLSEGHVEPQGYTPLEKLLEDQRPKPLLLPLKKAFKITKVATLFGWMNNLEISDGNTIPGLGDRVMSWDSRDEDFAEEESWIRKQRRYNPTYDIKGFYYRYIEPRFKPQLWDDMARDYSGTAPAKRFAAKAELDADLVTILSILTLVRSKMGDKQIRNIRLIMTEDVLPFVDKILGGREECQVNIFNCGVTDDGGNICSVWVSEPTVSISDLNRAEQYLSGNGIDEDKPLIEELLGSSKRKERVIGEIISVVKEVCETYGIKDVYLAGGYPRDMIMENPAADTEDLDFSCAWPNQSLKLGGLVAKKLGPTNVNIFHRTMTLSFVYKDVKVDFKGHFSPKEIEAKLREKGIKDTPLNIDIYNRDFTMNMLIYDFVSDKVYDISGRGKDDIENKVIRTYFDADYVCKQNPIVILRALKYKLRYGIDIDEELQKAMITNAPLLLGGRYSDRRLVIARENVEKEGRKEAQELFREFGLDRLNDL